MGMCRSSMKAINCQRFLCHTFQSLLLSRRTLCRATFGACQHSFLREDMFSISPFHSPVSLWLCLGFFLSSQTRQTSDPTPDWLGSLPISAAIGQPKQRGSLSLISLPLTLSLSWLCSRVGWFGMTISQGRNADNRSELPGVAASQLTRNKAFLTD